ncbi:MAG TPA: pyridoxal phosphate-dependent aminotransferase [Cyclobacteriaceae bacterium]
MIEVAKRLKDVQEYYFSRKLEEIRQRISKGHPIINLGIGNPDLQPPADVIAEVQNGLNDQIHGYQPYKGIPELRAAIKDWMKKNYNIHLDADQNILPLIGSKEGIFHLSMAFLNPGDKVLVPDPGYLAYGSVAQLLGAQVISYDLKPENNWNPDLKEIDFRDVKIMWLNTPHMPTGSSLDIQIIDNLIQFARKHNFLIINDNPYSFILNENPSSILVHDNAFEVMVELNSLSKSHHMAGWRVGWLSGRKEVINAVIKVKSNVDSGMFKGIQLGAVKALETSREWHDLQNKEYSQRKTLALRILNQLGCSYSDHQQGMFIWAKIPSDFGNSSQYSDYLLNEMDLFIPPGIIFGKNGERYIRVSLCVDESKINEALNRTKSIKI